MIYGGTPAYSISKAALIALTMKAAVELVKTSIQVILLTLDGWLQTLV
jgi:NAD(P)-dependent dehydrogenase (short-subunit alcohol dehydrogenase family)